MTRRTRRLPTGRDVAIKRESSPEAMLGLWLVAAMLVGPLALVVLMQLA